MRQSRGPGVGVLALLAFLLGGSVAWPAAERPRIGLALSGGAALGLAHVGVLRWLDENRIPVDYVAGTSMGGLVGAMYALGMPPEDIHRLATSLEWEQLFEPRPDYRSRTFRRKEDETAFPGGVGFGLRRGIRWPSGLDAAQPINLLLSRLSFPYSDLPSFDDLPIPFACVAVDLTSADREVLRSGSLALALRATMAIPGLFTPVEIDGKVLVDGGVLDNLPVGVVHDMGADVALAVDVLSQSSDGQFLQSPLDVLERSVDVVIRDNVEQSLKLAGVAIAVPLEGFSTAEYQRAAELADLGYRAAAANAGRLRAYSLDPAAWKALIAARQARRRSAAFVPRHLQLVGGCNAACRTLTRTLSPFIGRPLNLRRLEYALDGIAGQGRVESILYEKTRRGDEDGLLVRVQEKPYGPPFVDALFDVDGADTDAVQFNLPVRLTHFDVGGSGAELRTDLTLGSRTRLGLEYYRPLGREGWFVAPRGFFDRQAIPFASLRRSEGGFALREINAGLDLGRPFGRDNELRIGVDLGHADLAPRGRSGLPAFDGRYSFLSARWTTDHQDDAAVPSRGTRFHVDARWYLRSLTGDRGFPGLTASATGFRPLGPKGTLFVLGSVGAVSGGKAVLASRADTASPLRLGPWVGGSPFGSHHLLMGAGYLQRVSQLPSPVGRRIYVGGWYTQGGIFDRWEKARLEGTVTGGVLAETAAGPVFLGASWAEGTQRFHFAIGRFLKSDGP